MDSLDQRLQNKWWRLTHLYKIKDKRGRVITFRPNYPQLKHLAERGSTRYFYVLKARQFGFTTLYCIDLLDEALWVPGSSCAILGHEREAIDMIFDIVKRAYTNLPMEIKPVTKADTTRMLRFVSRFDGAPLDSMIYVALKLRSGTVRRLHVTESAYIKDRQELVAGSKQAVPMSGSISEETTANGFNEFYDAYMEAATRSKFSELDYKSYFYPWFENPEYSLPGNLDVNDKTQSEIALQQKHNLSDGQILWRRWKMDELKRNQTGLGLTGEQLFKQEYPSSMLEAFQSGAGHVFDPEKINAVQPLDPIEWGEIEKLLRDRFSIEAVDEEIEKCKKIHQLGLEMWELPKPETKYIVGVDPSDGDGADYSCVDVWDRDGLGQVAQFYGKLRPDELAGIVAEIGNYYNKAFVGVENNMLSTILFLSKIYDNYYFETRIDEKTLKRTKKIGWATNVKTRDVMIDDFNIIFDEGHLTIRSKRTLNEMKTFVKKESGKREHADGKHDDALFAGFVALQMRKFDRPKARAFATNPLQ